MFFQNHYTIYKNTSGRWNIGSSRCIFLCTDVFSAAQMLLGTLQHTTKSIMLVKDRGAQHCDSLLYKALGLALCLNKPLSEQDKDSNEDTIQEHCPDCILLGLLLSWLKSCHLNLVHIAVVSEHWPMYVVLAYLCRLKNVIFPFCQAPLLTCL